MADDVTLPGTGENIAALESGGKKFQRLLTAPDRPTTQALTWAVISCASSGINDLIAATGGQTIRVMALYFTLASPTTVKFHDDTPTNFTGVMTFGLGGGLAVDDTGEPLFVTATGKKFQVTLGSAVQMSGWLGYTKS